MANIQLDVYIFFMGTCRDAMEFYKEIFGGELTMQTYAEVPGEKPDFMQGMDDKIMHAMLTGSDVRLMGSDSTRKEPFGQSFITISLGGTDEARLREVFDKLSDGGEVTSPLKKEFWGDTFGTVTDKFGVEWMVNITAEKE
jgi:PhnB protein